MGEAFSLGDAKIYFVSKAGRVELQEGQYTVSTGLFNPNFAGSYNIVVMGQGAVGIYEIQVVAPTSITVEGAKTEFGGEEFSTGDIVVKAMVNGEEYVLDESQYTINSSAFKKDKNGTYVIKVTAGGKSTTYEVTVSGISSASASGCGANAMEIFTLIAGLCVIAFAFKKK
jgi:hypothetical protein